MDLSSNIQLGRVVSVRAIDPSIPEAFDAWFTSHGRCREDRFSVRTKPRELAAALLSDASHHAHLRKRPRWRRFASPPPHRERTPSAANRGPKAAPVPGLPRHRSLARILIPAFATIAIAIAAFMRLARGLPAFHVASPAARNPRRKHPHFPAPPKAVEDSITPPPPYGEERRGGKTPHHRHPLRVRHPQIPSNQTPPNPSHAASTDPAPSKSTDAAPAPPPKPAHPLRPPSPFPPRSMTRNARPRSSLHILAGTVVHLEPCVRRPWPSRSPLPNRRPQRAPREVGRPG